MVYRGPRRKGVRYSGRTRTPGPSGETLDLFTRVFPARTCSAGVFKRHKQIDRPCLLGYIDKCSAPCVGRVSAERHREIVRTSATSCPARPTGSRRELEQRMNAAAEKLDFERAARLRDDLGALNGRWRSRRWCSVTVPTPTWWLSRRRAGSGGASLSRPRRPGARPAGLDRRKVGRSWGFRRGVDHANCEKKAASTALALMFAYAEDLELTDQMSRLAREELRHYEQVAKLIGTLEDRAAAAGAGPLCGAPAAPGRESRAAARGRSDDLRRVHRGALVRALRGAGSGDRRAAGGIVPAACTKPKRGTTSCIWIWRGARPRARRGIDLDGADRGSSRRSRRS